MTKAPTIGPFEAPPITFTDGEGREIRIRAIDRPSDPPSALVSMYEDFDREKRAQGLPPVNTTAIEDWLAQLTGDPDACNVVARHGDRAVGHATLVPDASGDHELAIFVHQAYQGAGIGTRLLRALLGHGQRCGVDHVWLTVERWNHPAIALYEKVGFDRRNIERFTLEMHAELGAPPGD